MVRDMHKHSRMVSNVRLIFGGVLLLFVVSLKGELPPSAYRDLQAQAPEDLEIEVLKVSGKTTRENRYEATQFVVKAQVTAVHRTASGLTRGRTIEIRYERRSYFEPIAGPSEVAALSEHAKVPAFLSRSSDGDYYTPAARGYSFERVN